jgi:DNA polymerase III epsilon subunit-like protein
MKELISLAKMLDIQRPLVGLDLETTGFSTSMDRIVQIGAIKLTPEGEVIEKSTIVNPGIHIPREVAEVHGITDAIVAACKHCDASKLAHEGGGVGCNEGFASWPTFKQLAKSFAEFIHMVDWCGYNVSFDIRFLEAEFKRCGVPATLEGRILDANKIMYHYHRRDLEAAVREYLGDEAAKEFKKGAHNAQVDVLWSMRVAEAQLHKHTELPRSIEPLYVQFFETPEPGFIDADRKFAWRDGEPVISFGNKWLSTPLAHVAKADPKFLRWIIAEDFSPRVKQIAQDALNGIFPVHP